MYICVFQSPGQIRSDVKSQSLLPAVNAALLELVAKQAAKNNDFTRINSDLKKQLDALNEALAEDNAARKEPASLLYQVRDDSVNMETSVDTGRASQDELEDEIEDMKTLMMLSANLQFQHEENQKLEKHWKVMHDALLDCEEKLEEHHPGAGGSREPDHGDKGEVVRRDGGSKGLLHQIIWI